MSKKLLVFFFGALLCCSCGNAATVFYLTGDGYLKGVDLETDSISDALSALASPPPGLESAVPGGTRVIDFSTNDAGITVQFSSEVLSAGMDDLRLETIFDQARATLAEYGLTGSIRLETEGRLLSDYLPPTPVVEPRPGAQFAGPANAPGGALSGKSISLSPGHGKVWTGSSYVFERPVYCAPLNREDDHNLEIMQYLNQYLTQDGAVTKVYRCLDKSFGTHTPSGEPWWRISAGYWLKQLGYPCSVYASSTGDCTLGAGGSESGDSLRSRGLASDYDNTDIYVSLHSNGFQGDCTGSGCPNGTCTYYDTSTEHATWGTISRTLATAVNAAMVNAIRTKYTDATWTDRGPLNANGSQAETRIPNRAAILIELAFHDSCSRDAVYLRDNFFRSTTMWATYKGICDYFGVTPGWDYYSYEVVSDTIPAIVAPGATVSAQITLRNRGVLWNDAKQFRLGAVNDSDPFSAATRFNVGAEIWPGATKTFTLSLKAPSTPGTYVTDWRMVREGVTWFGPTVSRTVLVSTTGDTNPPSRPTGLVATPASTTQIDLRWNPATDNVAIGGYRVYRDSVFLGTAATTNYSDATCAAQTTYSYEVSAVDTFGNEGLRSLPVQATTPPQLEFILDNVNGVAVGEWTTGTSSTDKYLGDYRWRTTSTTDLGTFRWTPEIQAPGFYNVYVWYPQGSNRCTNSPYTIQYAGGRVTVPVNQTTSGGQWRSLGAARPLVRGTGGYVETSNESSEPGKVVMADAVRFTYQSALPALGSLQIVRTGDNFQLVWSNSYAVLQESSPLSGGAWSDVSGAVSPYPVPAGGAGKFYRLRY